MLWRDFLESRGLPLLQESDKKELVKKESDKKESDKKESDKKEKGELQVDCVGNIEALKPVRDAKAVLKPVRDVEERRLRRRG